MASAERGGAPSAAETSDNAAAIVRLLDACASRGVLERVRGLRVGNASLEFHGPERPPPAQPPPPRQKTQAELEAEHEGNLFASSG